ncbi:MAG TPA: Holliday junction branch migration protein RuvA [Actinomycetota bacterium]|nr:Holliday junction branch migration protein RuvA [Actinomycetota bacterium]
MIGYLDGTIGGRTADGCFLEVGGVGYRVSCSATTGAALPPEGSRAKLWTFTYVREDALALFGFATAEEQSMFEALLSVSGIGPRAALSLCSAFTPDSFRRALVTDDVDSFSSVPGIGKKTAARILLDLKEKMALPDLAVAGSAPPSLVEARSALQNLGYSAAEVRAALAALDVSTADDAATVIKSALKVLAG